MTLKVDVPIDFINEQLLPGDFILLERWATVDKDYGDKVYFKWDNGDINWVWRENIEKAKRAGVVDSKYVEFA